MISISVCEFDVIDEVFLVFFLVFRDDLLVPLSPFCPVEAQGGQGPSPMVQERFHSVISQLFQHVRRIRVRVLVLASLS